MEKIEKDKRTAFIVACVATVISVLGFIFMTFGDNAIDVINSVLLSGLIVVSVVSIPVAVITWVYYLEKCLSLKREIKRNNGEEIGDNNASIILSLISFLIGFLLTVNTVIYIAKFAGKISIGVLACILVVMILFWLLISVLCLRQKNENKYADAIDEDDDNKKKKRTPLTSGIVLIIILFCISWGIGSTIRTISSYLSKTPIIPEIEDINCKVDKVLKINDILQIEGAEENFASIYGWVPDNPEDIQVTAWISEDGGSLYVGEASGRLEVCISATGSNNETRSKIITIVVKEE